MIPYLAMVCKCSRLSLGRSFLTLTLFALSAAGIAAQDLAITNVTVIDPSSAGVHSGRTVLIDAGVIRSVTSSGQGSSTASTAIDGTGKFLIPGLWNMHTHLDSHAETDLMMMVVNGVLNARDMGGDALMLADLKARIADGELVGPTIRGAGAILEDRAWLTRARKTFEGLEHRLPVDNPEEARATIAMLDSWGVDLIKVRNLTDQRTLRAIVAAAEAHDLTVAGHEPIVVDIDEAANLGMTTFEHVPFISLTMPGKETDDERLVEVIDALLASGAYLDPTIIASNGLGKPLEERAAAIDRPDERYQYLPDSVKEQWLESLEDDAGPLPWAPMRERSFEMLIQMHEAGVPLLAGTDMGVPLTFPGFALHDELELMVDQLGLEPMAALRSATSAPASLFGVAGGAIAPGMAADLILLDADPLENIGNTRTIRAVVVRGKLYDRAKLDELLDHVREHKDDTPASTALERLESTCRSDPTADCLERLAGHYFSTYAWADARATYEKAIAAGSGKTALEGLFASTVNALFEGEIDCTGADSALQSQLEALLAHSPDDANKTVGLLDRALPALGAGCAEEQIPYLTRLAAIDEAALDEEMGPVYREHYASYLARVEGDGEAAYQYRLDSMPDGWVQDSVAMRELATWCLEQNVALPQALDLTKRAVMVAKTPIDRLYAMLLQARIASAQGDHATAVTLMETIDKLVPNNETVTGLLEQFRELASEDDSL